MEEYINTLEEGEKFLFQIPQLDFKVEITYVVISTNDSAMKIASFNLIGMARWNRILGKALARKIKETIGGLEGVVFLTAVEKALQLTQVVCQELGVDMMAIAYNRKKPHMETKIGRRRPFIQVGGGSVTSGDKYLVLYERDVSLLARAHKGVVIIDDVVSTGGTIAALATLLDEITEKKGLDKDALRILGIFCVAREGEMKPLYKGLSRKIYWLGTLPAPEFL